MLQLRTIVTIFVFLLPHLANANCESWRPKRSVDKPPVKQVRSTPYVIVETGSNQKRQYETNNVPLLPDRSCFGWRLHLGGPYRVVALKESLTTSSPTAQWLAGGPDAEISPDGTRATSLVLAEVQNGILQRSWCINPQDQPGTYSFDLTIEGESYGEFVFNAIAVTDQNPNIDPSKLSCTRN